MAHSLGVLWKWGEFPGCIWSIILTRCPSWQRTHSSVKMESITEDSGNLVGHVVSPFDLSQILPVGGGLLVPCFLPGPPVIK